MTTPAPFSTAVRHVTLNLTADVKDPNRRTYPTSVLQKVVAALNAGPMYVADGYHPEITGIPTKDIVGEVVKGTAVFTAKLDAEGKTIPGGKITVDITPIASPRAPACWAAYDAGTLKVGTTLNATLSTDAVVGDDAVLTYLAFFLDTNGSKIVIPPPKPPASLPGTFTPVQP